MLYTCNVYPFEPCKEECLSRVWFVPKVFATPDRGQWDFI